MFKAYKITQQTSLNSVKPYMSLATLCTRCHNIFDFICGAIELKIVWDVEIKCVNSFVEFVVSHGGTGAHPAILSGI